MATTKEVFRTPVSAPKIVYTPAGEELEDVWEMKLDEKGNEIFYVSGKKNVYERTQMFAEECDIENIIRKCRETGDLSALELAKGSYMDLTVMPKTYAEAANKIREVEEQFAKLPADIKEKFDNNFMKYLSEAGSDTWLENMGVKQPTAAATEEVKEEAKSE